MDDRSKNFSLAANATSLNRLDKRFNFQSEIGSQTDTTLQLVSPGSTSIHGFNLRGTKRKWGDIDRGRGSGHGPLPFGLLCSPSTSESSKRSSGTLCTVSSANVADEECSVDIDLNFELKLDVENAFIPKSSAVTASKAPATKPDVNLQLSLSVGPSASAITSEHRNPAQHLINTEASTVNCPFDDESVTSCWRNGSCLNSYIYSSVSPSILPPARPITIKTGQVPNHDLFSILREVPKSPVDTSGKIEKQYRSCCTKNCQYPGCPKGARGASGLCIAHGGGRRCQKVGCQKGAEGKTIYCKAHGGGRRCEHLGCTKSAEGRTDKCIAHGGGRRCSQEGCARASRGKSGLCIRHGGGKRCRTEYCTKSAEGQSGLCIAHGGGKRCQYSECKKGAQGSTMFCKAHGGGKRCSFPNCSKGAEGSTSYCKGHGGGKRCLFQGGGLCPKSVHGGTDFCVAHGGGKRCAIPDCTKSARGRTDFCVRHGGGKRCQFDGCGKSAQGSTNFCKAHGGGKRCSWGQPRTDIGVAGAPCDRFARGKIGLCAAHSALLKDHRIHGGDTIGTLTSQKPATKDHKMKGVVVEDGTNLVSWSTLDQRTSMHPAIHVKPGVAALPEGRVHGGSLMALLGTGSVIQGEGCSTSHYDSSYTMNYGCL